MSLHDPGRRDLLKSLAAVPFLAGALDARAESSSAVCFMSTVEMARLIRSKKLSAREALAAHLDADRAREPEGQCDRDAGPGNGRRRGGQSRRDAGAR